MMKKFTGKNVDEATGEALQETGVELEDLNIKVVNPGRSGILGFGGEPAEIEVSLASGEPFTDENIQDSEFNLKSGTSSNRNRRKSHMKTESTKTKRNYPGSNDSRNVKDDGDLISEKDEEAEKLIGQLLDYFLGAMGVVAETYVREDKNMNSLVFEIDGPDSGLLIGRRGETLRSLQFIIRLIASRQLGKKIFVSLDIEEYTARRHQFLRNLAQRTAREVTTSSRSIELDPMPSNERRIIHMSLSRSSRVTTESEGEGSKRYVIISPGR